MNLKWSYSSLKTAMTCPRQYHEVKVLKNFEPQDNEQSVYGKKVHTALELYGRDGVPLPKHYRRFQPAVDALLAIPGEKHFELKMGLLPDRVTACDFDDENYWVHGIADLVIINSTHAFVVDYKTGNPNYADPKQLRLMALMVFAKFSAVQQISAALLFLQHELLMPDADMLRDKSHTLWVNFDTDLARLNVMATQNSWPPQTSGLCRRHCPVTTCNYHGR